jgi:MFS transporter, PAT family, beta-lactamase induction signal transducer AmpG
LLPNLLATRPGRLVAFTLLYVTEGVPFAFAAIAMTTHMKRQGFDVAAIGYFSAAIFVPWGFKWLAGPFVDVIYSRRLGRRRGWILAMQVLMVLSLLAVKAVGFGAGLTALAAIVMVHNCFAAVQDVAIDALAVQTLHVDERGLANGLMFAGGFLGQSLGGGVALIITSQYGFDAAFYFACAMVLLVTVLVVLPMREPATAAAASAAATQRWLQIKAELLGFVRQAWQAFTAERAAWLAIMLAGLPIGALALSTAMTNNLAVELGFNDARVGQLQLYTTIIGAVASVIGGWMSDRHGRRLQIGLGAVLVGLPTLYLAWRLQQAGVWLPTAGGAPRAGLTPELVDQFWWVNMIYSVFFGYIYGSKFALFMDVTRPAVAATQFTAYMAIANLTLSYTSVLQGHIAMSYGYPTALVVDALLGIVCLALLPLMRTVAGK